MLKGLSVFFVGRPPGQKNEKKKNGPPIPFFFGVGLRGFPPKPPTSQKRKKLQKPCVFQGFGPKTLENLMFFTLFGRKNFFERLKNLFARLKNSFEKIEEFCWDNKEFFWGGSRMQYTYCGYRSCEYYCNSTLPWRRFALPSWSAPERRARPIDL